MNKLPVGRTIADAYRFTFAHLGAIIGLIWLPLVLATLLNFLPEIGGSMGDAGAGPMGAGTAAVEDIAIPDPVPVARRDYLCGRRPTGAGTAARDGHRAFRSGAAGIPHVRCKASFSDHRCGWRPNRGSVLLLRGIGGLTAMQNSNVYVALPSALLALGGCFALLYALVRLGYLLLPVTVIENRVDLAPAAGHSPAANSRRIVLVLLAIVAPIWIFETGTVLVLMGKELTSYLAGGREL